MDTASCLEQEGAVGVLGSVPGSALDDVALCDKLALVFEWLGAAGCCCCPQSRLVLGAGFACVKSAFSEAVNDSFFPLPHRAAMGKNTSGLHT